ncbi:hypothetical protein ON010_g19098 [Phytophthora cinnamomi]|nr:hypothetical protein ON010_g19098 [Phytophthora cinnamomi]
MIKSALVRAFKRGYSGLRLICRSPARRIVRAGDALTVPVVLLLALVAGLAGQRPAVAPALAPRVGHALEALAVPVVGHDALEAVLALLLLVDPLALPHSPTTGGDSSLTSLVIMRRCTRELLAALATASVMATTAEVAKVFMAEDEGDDVG